MTAARTGKGSCRSAVTTARTGKSGKAGGARVKYGAGGTRWFRLMIRKNGIVVLADISERNLRAGGGSRSTQERTSHAAVCLPGEVARKTR